MNIEVQEFYELERDDKKGILKGSLHIYIIDLDLDLRFIYANKNKSKWFFSVPSFMAVDEDTKEKVRVPIFSFLDKEKNQELIREIRTKGKEFILEKYQKKS